MDSSTQSRIASLTSNLSHAVSGALLIVACSAMIPAARASTLLVQTQAGAVQGIDLGFQLQWRGIPYAAPPIGQLRWRAPASAQPWAGVRDATHFGAHCIQPFFDGGTEGSEDCLFLNVSAPEATNAGANLPVMVHLHGGANLYGSAYEDTRVFTDQGVIVVTLNYRLGAMGFIAHPALTAEGGGSSSNYALMDQIAALSWVRDNIASFGGDPSNVTLFGFSAGAFDGGALMVSPLARGLFNRVALHPVDLAISGAGFSLHEIELVGGQLAQSVGCDTASDVLTCLRAVPADQIVLAFGETEIDPVTDGKILPKPVIELMGDTSGLPLLIGSGREEWGYEVFDSFVPNPMNNAQYVLYSNDLLGNSNGARARSLFAPSAYESTFWAFIQMGTDLIYSCPVRRFALANKKTTYRFLSTHVIENDPGFAVTKASHETVDLLLWGATGIWNSYAPTTAEQALSLRMQRYWTNFAKTGDPNGTGLPRWPAYDSANGTFSSWIMPQAP
jgi:para-nitrobenzyl esterase